MKYIFGAFFAVKYIHIVIGTASVAITYLLGLRLWDRRTARLAAWNKAYPGKVVASRPPAPERGRLEQVRRAVLARNLEAPAGTREKKGAFASHHCSHHDVFRPLGAVWAGAGAIS